MIPLSKFHIIPRAKRGHDMKNKTRRAIFDFNKEFIEIRSKHKAMKSVLVGLYWKYIFPMVRHGQICNNEALTKRVYQKLNFNTPSY